jgi:hypothetical protein
MTESKLTIEECNRLGVLGVLEDDRVKERIVTLFQKLHVANEDEGMVFYNREVHNFKKIISSNPKLKEATGFSCYGVFLDLVTMNLTLDDAGQQLLYLTFFNVKVGDGWERRLNLEISPYGELAARINAGQLAYSDRPVVVFEGDTFSPGVNANGQKYVEYKAAVPRKGKKVLGGFIRHVRPDKSYDFYWMLEDDIERLAEYSKKKNKGKTNELYTKNEGQIDIGFLEAKIIKHSFKTFPRLKLGQFSTIQDEPLQAQDYGLANKEEEIKGNSSTSEQSTAVYIQEEPEEEAPQPEENEVVVDVSDADEPF